MSRLDDGARLPTGAIAMNEKGIDDLSCGHDGTPGWLLREQPADIGDLGRDTYLRGAPASAQRHASALAASVCCMPNRLMVVVHSPQTSRPRRRREIVR